MLEPELLASLAGFPGGPGKDKDFLFSPPPCCVEGLNHAALKWAMTPVCPGTYPYPAHLAGQRPPGCRAGGTVVQTFTNHFLRHRPLRGIFGALAVSWWRTGYKSERGQVPPSQKCRPAPQNTQRGWPSDNRQPSESATPHVPPPRSCRHSRDPTFSPHAEPVSLYFDPLFCHLRPGPRASAKPPLCPASFPSPPSS